MIWKDKLLAAVRAWAAQHNVVVHEGYSGGSLAVRKDKDLDSFEMATGWLMRVLSAPEKTVPGTGEEDEWEWEELCLFKKIGI